MTTITVRPALRGRKLVVTLVLAAVTIGLVAAQIAIHTGSSNGPPAVSDRGYAESISSLSPEQLSAAFGTVQVAPAAPVTSERDYAKKVAALTPAQLAAAFGGGAPAIGSAGNIYVDGITSSGYAESISALSPAQLRAAFGTDQVTPAPTVTGESGYARKIAALPSRTLAAAFGGAAPAVRSSGSDIAKRIARLSPHERAAAFGVRR